MSSTHIDVYAIVLKYPYETSEVVLTDLGKYITEITGIKMLGAEKRPLSVSVLHSRLVLCIC